MFCLTKRERPKGSECKSELLGQERGNEGNHRHQEHRRKEAAGRVAFEISEHFAVAVEVETGAIVIPGIPSTPVVKVTIYVVLTGREGGGEVSFDRKRKRKQEKRAAYLLNTPTRVRHTSADGVQRRSGCGRQAIAITDLVVGTLDGVHAILGATSGTVFPNAPSRLASARVRTEGTGSERQLLDAFSVRGGRVDCGADVTSAALGVGKDGVIYVARATSLRGLARAVVADRDVGEVAKGDAGVAYVSAEVGTVSTVADY